MPQFYFDIEDGSASMHDEEGSELPDHAAARREATETLVQMARDVFRSKDFGTLSVVIRDETGAVHRRMSLTLVVEEP